ncbi:hypothetical protein VNO77_19208 [Canavalia gladiata]|uniref:Uncharacterized protein n=1 Tax=Canavalia gladiata TaxID=3824 RepID=A0AAN9LM06_CANGL
MAMLVMRGSGCEKRVPTPLLKANSNLSTAPEPPYSGSSHFCILIPQYPELGFPLSFMALLPTLHTVGELKTAYLKCIRCEGQPRIPPTRMVSKVYPCEPKQGTRGCCSLHPGTRHRCSMTWPCIAANSRATLVALTYSWVLLRTERTDGELSSHVRKMGARSTLSATVVLCVRLMDQQEFLQENPCKCDLFKRSPISTKLFELYSWLALRGCVTFSGSCYWDFLEISNLIGPHSTFIFLHGASEQEPFPRDPISDIRPKGILHRRLVIGSEWTFIQIPRGARVDQVKNVRANEACMYAIPSCFGQNRHRSSLTATLGIRRVFSHDLEYPILFHNLRRRRASITIEFAYLHAAEQLESERGADFLKQRAHYRMEQIYVMTLLSSILFFLFPSRTFPQSEIELQHLDLCFSGFFMAKRTDYHTFRSGRERNSPLRNCRSYKHHVCYSYILPDSISRSYYRFIEFTLSRTSPDHSNSVKEIVLNLAISKPAPSLRSRWNSLEFPLLSYQNASFRDFSFTTPKEEKKDPLPMCPWPFILLFSLCPLFH